MQLQTKLLTGADQRTYVLMIARGVLDAHGLQQILTKIAAEAMRHVDCRVLVDLIEADCNLEVLEIDRLFQEEAADPWPRDCKTALVFPLADDPDDRLSLVAASLVHHGLRLAVFRDARTAFEWLDCET